MSNNKMKKGHGMGHGGMGPVEKAKDFKGTIKQLSKHLNFVLRLLTAMTTKLQY